MDPLDRADALLSRARARSAFVVTPDNAVSPMDASSTVQIPRALVRHIDDSNDDTGPIPVITPTHHLADGPATTEIPVTRGKTSQQRHPAGAPTQVEIEDVGGLVPTTMQRMRSDLTRRLDG